MGGWSAVGAQGLEGTRIKGDERILGSADFVDKVLRIAHEQLEERTRLRRHGLDWKVLVERVADHFKVDGESLRGGRKERGVVRARSGICYLAVRKLGMSATEVARRLAITVSAVSNLAARGQFVVPKAAFEEFSPKC